MEIKEVGNAMYLLTQVLRLVILTTLRQATKLS